MKKTLLLIMACFCLLSVHAAYLKNVPMTLTQPDGTALHCYASGDEFFNYLHDENGFTIMQHPQTGFYVYADNRDGELVATEFVVGKVDPSSKNLRPFNLISPQEWMARRNAWKEFDKPIVNRDRLTNHGTLNNISIFIRFSDDAEFTNTYSSIDNMFNDESQNAISLRTYFRAASYGAIEIPTYFYPGHNGETIISYQDTYPRSYFQPYNSSTNTNGYESDTDRRNREFGLLERAVNYINTYYPVPTSLNIDYDNDGYVDNVCFIVRGNVGEWNSLLWPHKWSLYDRTVRINNKRVYTFNFQLADATGYFNTSTMCHEMNHSLGAPDLYHYSYTGPTPVGIWDLMENNTTPPQHCGAYMKMKYGHWLDEIPEITQAGTYTLNPISSATPTNIAYKIQSNDPDQYYVLEYRDNTSLFESGLPGSGLLIYRIDTRFDGNADYDPSSGIYDEVYIFRPGGSSSEEGNLSSAYFSSNVGRTEFSSSTDAYPFFTDGTMDYNFRIYDITSAGSTISFTYGNSTVCEPPTNLVASLDDNDVTLTWNAASNAQSYNIYRNGSLIGNTSGVTYLDSDLPVGDYNYFLRSVDANGLLSSVSETVTVNILPTGSIVIGDGGSATNVFLPSYSFYCYSLTQQIYTVEELGGAGYITSMAFYNGGAEKTRTYDFYLKSTTKDVFSSQTDWEVVSDADMVFSGTVTMTANAWTTINFSTPFVYDGTSNVVLVADDNTGAYTGSPHMSCRVFEASSQAIRVYSDNTDYEPYAPSSYSGTILGVKNQIIFKKVPIVMQVHADYYPDADNPYSTYVKVHWGTGIDNVEDFERGDFSMFSWQLDSTYPWSITTNNPYEGVYCMKSSNEGVHNSVSNMECLMQVPNDGQISFFSKISSESNYDFGYFYIDNLRVASYSGNGSWGERTFDVTAGIHTFKWVYSKDVSVNRYDDCFYVDYIRFYTSNSFAYDFEDSKLPVGWSTIDADGDGYNWRLASSLMGTGYGHNASSDCVFSQSFDNSYGVLYPDNYLVSEQVTITSGSHFSFYACAQDNNWVAEHFGVFVSLGSNSNPNDFQEVQSWTMTAKGSSGRVIEGKASRGGGTRAQGTWYYYDVDLSAYAGIGYIAIRHYNCSDYFYLDIDDVAFSSPSKSDRAAYRVYRAHCDGSGMQLIADNVTGNEYIDSDWMGLAPGSYMYGIRAVSNGREGAIEWTSGNVDVQHQPVTREVAEAMGIELSPSAFDGSPNPMDDNRSGNRSTWSLLGSYSCSSAYQYGVATDGVNIYHSAWSSAAGFQFAKYDMEGNFIETFEVSGCGYLRDMTYDGQYFYGGSAGEVLYCVDLAGKQLISSTSTECGAIRYCAYDPVRDGFWVGNWSTNIQLISRTGAILVTGPEGYSFSGAAYYKDKNDVEHVYMFAQPSGNAVIYDYNISSNTISSAPIFSVSGNLDGVEDGSSGGCFIGEAYGKIALFAAVQQNPNLVGIFELKDGQVAWSNCIEKPDIVQQVTVLNEGWNWWSSNIELSGIDALTMLEESLQGNGLVIKSRDAYVEYSSSTGTWTGSLLSIDNASGYKILMAGTCTSVINGPMAVSSDHPITLTLGWNWIGYPVSESQTVASALSGFTPAAGDIIKGQNSYATYSTGAGWTPSDFMLNPGESYMYYSNASGEKILIINQVGAK